MSEQRKCEATGCVHDAKWAPKINVPAEGWSVEQHQPLQMILGLGLCEPHFVELKIEDYSTSPELRQLFEIMATGKCAPDFARAWFSKVSVNSNEFKLMTNPPRPDAGKH